MIEDSVFGCLEFDFFGWTKNERISFCGKEKEVMIVVAGDEDEGLEEGQREAYKLFMCKWSDIQMNVASSIFDYYQKRREDLGYNIEKNESYPEISTIQEMLNNIILDSIKVHYADIFGGRSIGLSFDCTWNKEDGLGVRLCDEQVIEVGYQDIAI